MESTRSARSQGRARRDGRLARYLDEKIVSALNQSTRSLARLPIAAPIRVMAAYHSAVLFDRDMEGQRAKNSRNSIADDDDSVREATMDLIRVGFIV